MATAVLGLGKSFGLITALLANLVQGLPFAEGGIPVIFQTETIDIRQPKGKDGSPQPPLNRANPLCRYQCKDEQGQLALMGNLPKPYALQDDRYVDPGERVLRVSIEKARPILMPTDRRIVVLVLRNKSMGHYKPDHVWETS